MNNLHSTAQRVLRVMALLCTVAAIATLAGCRTAPTRLTNDQVPPPLPEGLAQFSQPGTHSFTQASGSVRSQTGCEVGFVEYLPAPNGETDTRDADRIPAVILAHGFLRSAEHMSGWAELFASHGIRTVTVSFCNSSIFNGNHARNALDLRLVAEAIAATDTPLIYAGYSAGGLSAALAAADDERTVGYLGIDPVDSGDLMSTIEEIRAPAFYLLGEPNPCNRDGATRPVLPVGRPAWLLEISYATHCTFEDPTDTFCQDLCGSLEPVEADETLRAVIQGLGTSFVAAQFGVNPGAMKVIRADFLARLEAAGYLRIVDPR